MYNKKSTQKIQSVELSIMKQIHDFCVQNNIKYYLAGGSVLGAIRNNGFIPWDDDIDIMMFREDYNKFINLSNKLPKDLYFQYPKNEKKCHVMFGKVRLKNTLYEEIYSAGKNYPKGIFVDIFPIDYVKKVNFIFKIKMNIIFALKKLFLFKSCGSIRKKYKLLSWFYNKEFGFRMVEKLSFSRRKYSYCINTLSNYKWKKQTRKIDILGDGILHKFEDTQFYIPTNYHEYLKQIFNDYMVLPPIEKRGEQHTVTKIEFNYDDSKYFHMEEQNEKI